MKTIQLAALALVLALAGCVSAKKYHALQDENEDVKARLRSSSSTAANLAMDKQKLMDEKRALESDKAALGDEKKRLERDKAACKVLGDELYRANQDSRAQYEKVLAGLRDEVDRGQLSLTRYRNMLRVGVAEKVFFDSGSAKLKKEGRAVLAKVGQALAPYADKFIRVLGHTDDQPIQQSPFKDNWELSVERASTVVRFLIDESQIEGRRLEAVGRSYFDPIAPNDSPEGRLQNRRIEILLIDPELFRVTQASAQAGAAGLTQTGETP